MIISVSSLKASGPWSCLFIVFYVAGLRAEGGGGSAAQPLHQRCDGHAAAGGERRQGLRGGIPGHQLGNDQGCSQLLDIHPPPPLSFFPPMVMVAAESRSSGSVFLSR